MVLITEESNKKSSGSPQLLWAVFPLLGSALVEVTSFLEPSQAVLSGLWHFHLLVKSGRLWALFSMIPWFIFSMSLSTMTWLLVEWSMIRETKSYFTPVTLHGQSSSQQLQISVRVSVSLGIRSCEVYRKTTSHSEKLAASVFPSFFPFLNVSLLLL